MIREESLATVFEVLTSNGLPQAEFTRALGLTSRDASRICQRLEKDGLIVRQRSLFAGRFTFMLKATPALTFETLRQKLTRRPIQPDMNFVAPDLTPRIKEAVSLRRKGLTVSEIAAKMRVGRGTIESYLHSARSPEWHRLQKEKALEHRSQVDSDTLSFIIEQLIGNGYLCTTDLKGLDKDKFRMAAEFLQKQEMAKSVDFPIQWKYFGTLAGHSITYVNSTSVADFIYSQLRPVLKDWTLRRKRGQGEGYSNPKAFRSAVSNRLGQVLLDPSLVKVIKDKMSQSDEY